MSDHPTEAEFRAVGFTAAAADHPLSEAGCAIIAEHNGVRVEQLPRAFRYSSNAYMHLWIEALGRAKATGRRTRGQDGRWLPMDALKFD